jgi:hypothetical protein
MKVVRSQTENPSDAKIDIGQVPEGSPEEESTRFLSLAKRLASVPKEEIREVENKQERAR